MKNINDTLRIKFSIKKKDAFKNSKILPILQLLDNDTLQKPMYIQIANQPQQEISSFANDIVINAINNFDDIIEIFDNDNNIIFSILSNIGHNNRNGFAYSLKSNMIDNAKIETIKSFFLKTITLLPFYYARGHFRIKGKDLHDNEYEKIGDRTFFASGLYWLNFFGPVEEEKQGGKALEDNPYATEIKRLDNGLFIQVGESPFDCYTDKGREQLINATRAMPPATW